MNRSGCIATLLLLSLTLAPAYSLPAQQAPLKGEIQVSGAFALYPLMVRWAKEFKQIHKGVRIDITAGGAGKGMTDVLSGVVDVAMVSRHIYPEEAKLGAFKIGVAKDAVVATLNTGHPLITTITAQGITRRKARRIWSAPAVRTWGEILGTGSTIPAHIYTRSDACGAGESWGGWLGMLQEDLEGTAVFGDPGVSSAVQKDKVGLGFNNLAYVYDQRTRRPYKGLTVYPIDVDENGFISPDENFYDTIDHLIEAIASGRYPSPPARELYLVTKGKPQTPLLKAFLSFILTRGQAWARETGFVPLTPEAAERELLHLE